MALINASRGTHDPATARLLYTLTFYAWNTHRKECENGVHQNGYCRYYNAVQPAKGASDDKAKEICNAHSVGEAPWKAKRNGTQHRKRRS